jgi:hypothetical protein
MEPGASDRTPNGRGLQFYHLKLRPEYPRIIKGIAFAFLHHDTEIRCLYFDRPAGSQWVVSLWIEDGACQVDLAAVLKEKSLDFIEGYCCHGDSCATVEKLKQAILRSKEYCRLREDLVHELFQRTVEDPDAANPSPTQNPVLPAKNKDCRR